MRHIGIFLFVLLAHLSQAQTDIGIELQAYPTGFIPGVSVDHSISDKGMIHARLGANLFDHRDLGVHDSETGSGWGGSLGYHHYFSEGQKGLFAGVRADVWSNHVEWSDNSPVLMGETDIIVLQPTLQLGYTMRSESGWYIKPALGFGIEWNVQTEGEPTGEGAILLLGVQVGKRF